MYEICTNFISFFSSLTLAVVLVAVPGVRAGPRALGAVVGLGRVVAGARAVAGAAVAGRGAGRPRGPVVPLAVDC